MGAELNFPGAQTSFHSHPLYGCLNDSMQADVSIMLLIISVWGLSHRFCCYSCSCFHSHCSYCCTVRQGDWALSRLSWWLNFHSCTDRYIGLLATAIDWLTDWLIDSLIDCFTGHRTQGFWVSDFVRTTILSLEVSHCITRVKSYMFIHGDPFNFFTLTIQVLQSSVV